MHRRSFASEGTSPKATRRARKRVRDRRAEAQPYKGMSQTKVKSRMYASKFPTERSPVAKCVMIAEANTDAPKSFCDAPDGTGHRDMARSESSARELGRPADGKPTAGVGGSRSSGEAGNDRGAKGSCIESASNRSAGADSLRKKRMTEEEIAAIAAKAMGQAMSIVRYADDFVILAKNWVGGFLRKVESILEERMGLTVNREKTKLLNLDAERSSLTFLGYEFRKVRDRLFGTGKRYLHFGPSPKSVKRVCQEVHKHTHSRNVLLPVDVVVDRVNKLLKGWGAFYSVGYPSRVFRKVNHYVLKRMARFLNRKSQRYYRLKFADTYYGEMTHYGLYRLAWADVRRAR